MAAMPGLDLIQQLALTDKLLCKKISSSCLAPILEIGKLF